MSWQCPECGSTNDGSLLRCDCGHVIDIPVDDEPGTQLRNKESAIKETEFYEVAIDKSLPRKDLTSTGQRLRDILLSVMFTSPVYIFSWIVLIGLSILRIIKWPFPVPPPFSLLLLIQIFCGIISANIARRKRKSPFLWFVIGFIPIGILFSVFINLLNWFYFVLVSISNL